VQNHAERVSQRASGFGQKPSLHGTFPSKETGVSCHPAARKLRRLSVGSPADAQNAQLVEAPFNRRKPACAAEPASLPLGFHSPAELRDRPLRPQLDIEVGSRFPCRIEGSKQNAVSPRPLPPVIFDKASHCLGMDRVWQRVDARCPMLS
jgi:hypothetical protein